MKPAEPHSSLWIANSHPYPLLDAGPETKVALSEIIEAGRPVLGELPILDIPEVRPTSPLPTPVALRDGDSTKARPDAVHVRLSMYHSSWLCLSPVGVDRKLHSTVTSVHLVGVLAIPWQAPIGSSQCLRRKQCSMYYLSPPGVIHFATRKYLLVAGIFSSVRGGRHRRRDSPTRLCLPGTPKIFYPVSPVGVLREGSSVSCSRLRRPPVAARPASMYPVHVPRYSFLVYHHPLF